MLEFRFHRLLHPSVFALLMLVASHSSNAMASQDVLLQTVDGKIVTGIVDDQSGVGTLGTRVYRRNFLSNFRASDPGFFGLATGNPNLPSGAAGFPANQIVNFDLLPMKIAGVASNLFYWDGSDFGSDGLDQSDVRFVRSPTVDWEVFDANFDLFAADGTDQFVPGGLIQKTSSDIDPSDGVDTGSIHKHLVLQLNDNNDDAGTSPQAGVYMIAWQVRSVGFETSDPFVFVHRTWNVAEVSDAVRDLAADWAIAHIDALFPPVLAGDYNDDHVVNAADYTVWRNSFGMSIALPNEDASPNFVDSADYEVWKLHFGETTGSETGAAATASVPEPKMLPILYAAVIGLTSMRLRPTPERRGPGSVPPRR